jgi:hypothetical protein
MFRLLFAIVGIIGAIIVTLGIREIILQKKRLKIMNTRMNNENSSKAKGELRIERHGDNDYLVWYDDILELPQHNKK